MLRCYLAHPVSEYGGKRQAAALAAIKARIWHPVNPDSPEHHAEYQKLGMRHFVEVIERCCDVLAFIRFEDGAIGAGVFKEIHTARANRMLIFDVSTGEMIKVDQLTGPILSVAETRARITAWRESK